MARSGPRLPRLSEDGSSALKAVSRSTPASARPQLPAHQEKRPCDAEYLGVIKHFEAAARCFQRRQYARAKEIFEKLASAPYPEIADRARLHSQLCCRKLESPPVVPRRVDHYLLGVAELNARHIELAIDHLTKADKSAPNREHIRYALAAAHAVRGNAELALEHLRAAVRLRPQNCFQARHDDDFQSLAQHPAFRGLVGIDTSHSAVGSA
jgi:tetratricopeptide (TPR) repeat protein